VNGLRGYVVVGTVLGLAACGTAYGTAPDEVPIGATDAAAEALPPDEASGDASSDVIEEEIIADPCAGKNLESDPENCGSCKRACGGGMTCIGGECKTDSCGADAGSTSVRGCDVGGVLTCVDTQTNQSHCGACGRACNFACTGGDCDRLVFVTSQTFTGALGGLGGADQKCQTAAQAAMKKGTFKAWLSDATKGPSTTFVKNPRKYLSTSGAVVANSWTDLTDGTLLSGISVTELGGGAAGDRAWSATSIGGAPAPFAIHCTNWTTEGNSGDTGRAGNTDSLWTDDNKAPCGTTRRLYCFEQ
jgi:hypothetical protein